MMAFDDYQTQPIHAERACDLAPEPAQGAEMRKLVEGATGVADPYLRLVTLTWACFEGPEAGDLSKRIPPKDTAALLKHLGIQYAQKVTISRGVAIAFLTASAP